MHKHEVGMNMYHLRPDDQGQPVVLKAPSQPTPLATWSDPNQIANVVPDGELPSSLNGIALSAWAEAPRNPSDWAALAASGCATFEEPQMPSAPGKSAASGVVVLESDGRVWVVSPSNAFGGYQNTFPKGKLEPGMNLRANALKEAFEESGLQVALTGFLCDAVRSTTVTRYYTARRLGGHPGAMGWESQAVHLVPRAQLAAFAAHPNDKPVVQALQALPAWSYSST